MISSCEPGGALSHRSTNACLCPLYAVEGCHVVTVEGIGNARDGLHPVQERLAKAHGSQCGFCTPGFVMSMYALLRAKAGGAITEEEIEENLAGNLWCAAAAAAAACQAAETPVHLHRDRGCLWMNMQEHRPWPTRCSSDAQHRRPPCTPLMPQPVHWVPPHPGRLQAVCQRQRWGLHGGSHRSQPRRQRLCR
jgi:hypothetical protein